MISLLIAFINCLICAFGKASFIKNDEYLLGAILSELFFELMLLSTIF